MKSKSEIQIFDARKKSEIRKRKSEAPSEDQTLPGEGNGSEIAWLQSSDFFRKSDFGVRIFEESPSLKQFNSEF